MKPGTRVTVVLLSFDPFGPNDVMFTQRARVVEHRDSSRRWFHFRYEKNLRPRIGYADLNKRGIDWAPGWGGKKVQALRAGWALR